MDKLVEITRFADAADAQVLISYLKAEGIQCNLRNELTNQVLGPYSGMGGTILEVMESDVERAMELMKAGGYDVYDSTSDTEKKFNKLASLLDKIPFLAKLSTEVRIIVLLTVIALIITALLFPFISK